MPVIRCLACKNEYSSADSLRCPKCKYPALLLSEKPDMHRQFKFGNNKDKASDQGSKIYGQAKNKQIKCVICSNTYLLSDLHCPKCQYPAISFTHQTNRYQALTASYRQQRINLQRVIFDRTITTQELDEFVHKYSEEIQKEIIRGYVEYADGGNPYAQYNLGMLHYCGYGIEKDEKKANTLFRKAALAGIPEAQYMRGFILLETSQTTDGSVKEWLEKEGAQWIEKAANRDHPEAQYYLGKLFLEGKVLTQDYKKAAIWFIKAAAKDNKEAAYELSILFKSGKGVIKNENKADQYYAKALELGYKDVSKEKQDNSTTQEEYVTQYNRGEAYYYGRGVNKDYHLAAFWYRKAADQGYVFAQIRLGELYERGLGVEQNFAKAKEWYGKVTDPDYKSLITDRIARIDKIQKDSGALKSNGKGAEHVKPIATDRKRVEQEKTKPAEQYHKAVDKKEAEKQYQLGLSYSLGSGVQQSKKKAAECYRIAADQGHADAQCSLGFLYESGQGVTKDYRKAFELYSKAANQGHSDAQNYLGDLYKYGNGVKQNFAKAEEWYLKAANQGNSMAWFSLGLLYEYDLNDYAKAAKWYLKDANNGSSIAQRNLGRLYERGLGVEQDVAKALKWYRKAAAQGDKEAADRLAKINKVKNDSGSFYGNGKAEKVDLTLPILKRAYTLSEVEELEKTIPQQTLKELAEIYKKHSEQGNLYAQANLGMLIYYALSEYEFDEDPIQLIKKPAMKGVAEAQLFYGIILTTEESSVKEGVAWIRKAAEQEYVDAQYYLGISYLNGDDVVQSNTEAAKWLLKAAEKGHADAQYFVGLLYELGEGLEEDYTKAAKWYRKAAEQGYADAQHSLGLLYEDGEGVEQNYTKAAEWYLKAANQGNADGQYNLGLLYELGNGVEENKQAALKWYRKAAAQGNKKASDRLAKLNKGKGFLGIFGL